MRTSKFWLRFSLSELSERTWEPDSEGVKLLQEGWKEGLGHFYLYVFAVDQEIGRDPEDFPAHHVAIYYSEKVKGEKWNIISAYPCTNTYYDMFQCRKNKFY